MRTKRIYNPKLRAWKPISGRSDFTQYRQQSRCQFLCIIGLRPTIKDCEVCFKFEERLPSAGPRPQEDLDNFKKMVEYWTRLRDKLEDGEITETEYYLKEIKFPMNPIDSDKEYTVSLNLDDDDQLLVQNLNEDEKAAETTELLKDLFPDFSYVKRKRKPKKE